MKKVFTWVLLLCVTFAANAQVQISVQKDSNVQFFISLLEAIENAESGSVITLPGGSFDIEELTINKTLRIVGIGHKASANPNGAYTRINGHINLTEGANDFKLEGVHFAGRITIGSLDDTAPIIGTTISRCFFSEQHLLRLSGGNAKYPSQNTLLHQNILEGIDGDGAENVLLLQNVIKGSIANLPKGATFRNNIFLFDGVSNSFLNVTNATFENNIFLCSFNSISSSKLLNNLFVADKEYNFTSLNNVAANNITDVPLDQIFVNVPDKNFDYNYNFQLQGTSLGKGAGTDQTDVGIYGTNLPFKDDCTPDIPHIDSYKIGSTTDEQGRLSISIKVSAQGN